MDKILPYEAKIMTMLLILFCFVNFVKMEPKEEFKSIIQLNNSTEATAIQYTSVRKCCEAHQFFSLMTNDCTNATHAPVFKENVNKLIKENNSSNIKIVPGRITECPNVQHSPSADYIDSHSHSLSSIGILHNLESDMRYGLDSYCIAIAANNDEELSSAIMLVISCPSISNEATVDVQGVPVRKCCEAHQFFNLNINDCSNATNLPMFIANVTQLIKENHSENITLIPGKLTECPDAHHSPSAGFIDSYSHSLSSLGILHHLESDMKHDHNNYCIAIAANNDEELSSAIMLVISCPNNSKETRAAEHEIPVRKCCEAHQFFNLKTKDCVNTTHATMFKVNVAKIIQENHYGNITLVPGKLTECPNVQHNLNVSYIDYHGHSLSSLGILHHVESDMKLDHDNYCIAIAANDEVELSSAFMIVVSCSSDSNELPISTDNNHYLKKCCSKGQIFSIKGCVVAERSSWQMDQLLQTRQVLQTWPPKPGCTPYPIGDKEQSEPFLITSSHQFYFPRANFTTDNYCVDDYIDQNRTHLRAFVCDEELFPTQASLNELTSGTVGKCCPENQYPVLRNITDKDTGTIINSRYICEVNDIFHDILRETKMLTSNITGITYTHFPECESGTGGHAYELSSMGGVEISFQGENLIFTDKYGKCTRYETQINKSKYCLDSAKNNSEIKTIAYICMPNWNKSETHHSEKSIIMGVFLGISCAALIATVASLSSRRVRRGHTTMKQMNTLSGRIQLSYVLSYLLGFCVLAISNIAEIQGDSPGGCRAIAGLIMFFMLAAFHWNTSICLESLLMTLGARTSDGKQYLLHSLWGWVLPALITSLALSLDAYKESLPCHTITPHFGVYRCFFSDIYAQMLYFYLPMGITLIANICLLSAAELLRIFQRKKLSGMEIHQNRNLWLVALKTVTWSGVTWSIEVLSYYWFRVRGGTDESWHEYLWYIFSGINALRGIGIFAIIVLLTDENRKKITKALNTLGSLLDRPESTNSQTQSGYSTAESAVVNSSSGNESRTSAPRTRNQNTNNGTSRNPHSGTTITDRQNKNKGILSAKSDLGDLNLDSIVNRGDSTSSDVEVNKLGRINSKTYNTRF